MVAHGAPGYSAYRIGDVPAGEGRVWKCTDTARPVMIYGNFLAMVWLGSDQRGLLYMMENNEGWQHAGEPDQEIIRQNGRVVLRLNVIQEPVTLTGQRTIRFGLLPTPMRKMVPGWRTLNTSFAQNFSLSWRSKGAYNASLTPHRYRPGLDMALRNTQNMITRFGGNELAPHTERGSYQSISRNWEARGYFGPEWARNTWTRSFQNHILAMMQDWIDRGGLTGIYHDQFFPAPNPNSITGAAWVLPNGRTNLGYNLRKDRKLQQREHALFLQNGIQPRIFCHTTNGGQFAAYPWVSAVLDGEDNMIIANADYDWVDLYPPERMQAYGNPWPWGNTFYWMRLIQRGDEKWQARQDRAFAGWNILHDCHSSNAKMATAHRRAAMDWGLNDRRVEFWPYWRNQDILQVSDPEVLVSMWTLPDRAMLCAFNHAGEGRGKRVRIRVPLRDLGLFPGIRSEYITGGLLVGGQGRVNCDAWSGTFTVRIQPHDFVLLKIRKYRD
jgi:hypothetical protein